MKSKSVNSQRLITFIVILASIIGLVSIVYIILYTGNKQAVPESGTAQKLSYVVDESKTLNWWTSGTLYSRESVTDDYIGDVSELPVADIIIHHGESRSAPVPEDNCFVTLSYFDAPLDLPAELAKAIDAPHRNNSGLTMRQVSTQKSVAHTFEGSKDYQLNFYEIIGESSEKILRGNAAGFIEMKDGYVSVRANCDTPGQLEQIMPVLDAVTLTRV